MESWDERDAEKASIKFVTINKKHFERLLMIIGGTGVLVGFAIYANFFSVC